MALDGARDTAGAGGVGGVCGSGRGAARVYRRPWMRGLGCLGCAPCTAEAPRAAGNAAREPVASGLVQKLRRSAFLIWRGNVY